MIEAEVQHPCALSAGDAETWLGFCEADPAFANPLLGPEFARLVGAVREDARVAVFSRGGRCIGFLPFHARPNGFAQPIGAAFSDYQALVTAPGEPIDGPEALAAARISGLRLNGLIDPYGAFPSATPSELEGYVIEPGPSPEAYYASLQQANPKRFKNWRRLQNKLERERGEIVLTAEDTRPEALDQLIAWKREQFRRTGAHDVFRPDWARALFNAVFESRGQARGVLICLYAGGELAAGHFGLAVGRRAHAWLSVFNPDVAACGPGQILALRLAEIMPGLGLESYDLSPGYAHYKAPFATRSVRVGEILATAEGRAGAAARSLNAVWALAGDGRSDTVARLRRRLDHINAVELSFGGQVRGVVDALAGYGRRASSRETRAEPAASEA